MDTQRTFFRADHVGSLLRPLELLKARRDAACGLIAPQALEEFEDQAIRQVAALQEEIGFEVFTDGEYRRENWWIDFIRRIQGVHISDGEGINPSFQRDEDSTFRYAPKNVFTERRLSWTAPITTSEFRFLAGLGTCTPKMTIPSPSRMHFHGGRNAVSVQAYPDIEEFFSDVAKVYRAELKALEEAGCRYIQIDDPLFTYFVSDRLRAEIIGNGEDPTARLSRYVALINDCTSERRHDTTLAIHLCRGNSRSGWISEGGYERIAEEVFSNLDVDSFLLEYDDERSGDFKPLRFIPKGRIVVLGLITTKRPQLETQDNLKRRLESASRYIDLEHLALSPQCGFASVVEGNIISFEDQRRKLELTVDTARDVWGTSGAFRLGDEPKPR